MRSHRTFVALFSRCYKAYSFSFFSGKTLTLVDAGLRGISISSPGRKGFGTPFLAGLAGRVTHLIFNKPGNVNSPTARFFICLSIKVSNSSKTADTSFCQHLCFLRFHSVFRFLYISSV